MSAARFMIGLYLQDGTRTSTLNAQAADTRKDVIQLAIWLANAVIGTAVVQASGEGPTIHVARHPKATRPADIKAPGAGRGANGMRSPVAVPPAAGCPGEVVATVAGP
jgi:hypothetical protein